MIELTLVLALLAIVLSIAAPSLSRFFRGRTLDEEAARFLALTRYAQSRAVSEGVPMVLWINAKAGSYGLEAETTFTDTDPRAVEFDLNEGLQAQVEQQADNTAVAWQQTERAAGNQPALRFTPDGFISDSSPARIVLMQGSADSASTISIGRSRNRLNYEIQTDIVPSARR